MLDLDTETVNQAYPVEPVEVDPSTPVRQVMELMRRGNHGGVLICRDEKLLGVFTERDALSLMAEDGNMEVPIQQVMTRDPDTLAEDDPISMAISKMSHGGYRRLPIVDPEGRPTGVLRATGLLHYLVEHFPSVVYTLPPAPHHRTKEREGA